MAFKKSNAHAGKKQAPMPGPNSAAYKKIVAAKKAAAIKAAGKRKPGKHSRSGATYSTLKSRQMVVERAKREIWASMLKINESIIALAKAGNFGAAKSLFDFAGVYSLPDPEDENMNVAALPAAISTATPDKATDPIDAFFRSIGVPPSTAEPEPEAASAG